MKGFSGRFLQVVGVGYKAKSNHDGTYLNLRFGKINIDLLNDSEVRVFTLGNSGLILCTGTNHQKVTQFAAKIRAIKRPDRYKGKGIRYK
jgi:large subunit ribosomal protein L6